MQPQNIYLRTTDLGGASAREAEILAFGLCNARMHNAADAPSRIAALHQNHQLWSALVRDLAGDANQLPAEIKQQLIALGLWSMRYGTLAAIQDLPLTPLIEVNRNIADGLKEQAAAGAKSAVAAGSTTAPTPHATGARLVASA